MHSLTGSEHPSRSSEAKLFGIEFSYLHVSKEDSIEARCDQLDSQLFEAEYFADEDSVLVPANVAAIVDSSQLEPLRVPELRQLSRQSYRAGDVKTRGNLVVQTLMRALVVKHVAEVIESALLCSKGCRRWFSRVLLQGAMHPLVAAVLLWPTRLNALMHDPSFIHPSESFDSPKSPVPANGAPLSVLILAGMPYSRIAASQIARTWLRSMRETIWQRIK